MRKQIFEIGDKVFDIMYGWGVVLGEVKNCDDNPGLFRVMFEKGRLVEYFPGGDNGWGYPPTLSFTEYTLEGFSQERPEVLPIRGHIVWVRDQDWHPWQIAHFIKKGDSGYIVSSSNRYEFDIQYKYMTIHNPYEQGEETN